MFAGFVGLIAMSTSLSPLSAGPSFDMFASVTIPGAACAAVAPKIRDSAANAQASTRILISPLLFSSPVSAELSAGQNGVTREDSRRCLGSHALGGFEQLFPGAELHSRTTDLLPGRLLALVD